ncbi:MAG: T9SS type A sorting domain-containing protein, partial [Flavobacteriales bacterium]|nr:T9SS type A sorting domain-containing protein [Flavobacteriales bacterium]
ENPDTLLLIDKKKFYPNGSPRSIFKWPVKYFEEGANNENRALPNKRYQWQVRCACEHGDGPESPWSEIKFFDTPDFDMNTGEFEGLISQNDSESKSFGLQSSRHDELTVWPNPTSGEINVSIPSVLAVNMKKGFPLIVELIDGLGRVVPRSTFEISLSPQQQYMIVKLDPLPPGVYLLRSVMGSEVYSNTIIKE